MAVFKKGSDYWIDYYFEGRRRRQKIGGAKKDATEALAKIRVKIASGDYVPPDRRSHEVVDVPTFQRFSEDEFLPWSNMQHSEKHHRRLRGILTKHLYPVFGSALLSSITAKDIESYRLSRFRQGRKPVSEATVNRELCCIKVVFRQAVQWGFAETNPARDVRTLKESPEAPRLLSGSEVEALLAECPDHLRGMVSCAVYAGLRSEELQNLQWKDIDWEAGELTVASRRGSHTKNYENRRIPMSAALVEDLRHHPRVLGADHVFSRGDGTPYRSLRTSLKNAASRAGIEGFVGLHQLRHAFCSHCLMQGIDPRTVQRWMGHKDLKTTLRYAHVSPDHEKAAIQRLSYGDGHHTVTRVFG